MKHLYDVSNQKLRNWIQEVIELCEPNEIQLCDGSEEEYQKLCRKLVEVGTFIPLNPNKRPGSFLARSTPDDVARVEERTFICSKKEEDAGPTNNWKDPKEMRETLRSLFQGCMKGRTMYIIPFSMGPINSSLARIGVEITDSPYVVCNMKLMTHIGEKVLHKLGNGNFIPCLHSVGVPLADGQKDVSWPCNPKKKIHCTFS